MTIVSENLARELWRSPAAALGKRIREGMKDDWRELIGVVEDVHQDGADQEPPTVVYWPVLMKHFWGNDVFGRQRRWPVGAARRYPSIRFPAALPRRNEVGNMNRETKFLHLKTPAILGERTNGWRVCWLGGWDRGRLFYLMMGERPLRSSGRKALATVSG